MADKKISELSVATTPLSGSELIPVVQGGVTKRIPASVLVSVGPQGPQGPAGPAGPQGPQGDPATLVPATTTTLGAIKVGSNLTIADDGTLSALGGGGGGGVTPDISMTATVDGTSGTPAVTVTKSGPLDAPTFNLAFTGIAGAQGAQGAQGPQGPQGDPAVLSAATGTTLGGIKVGSGLAVTPDGTLSATGGGGGTAGVSSFNGRTGAVASQSGDYTAEMVGLGNVDNTADANKPISTATQAALDEKANLADMNTALDAKANTADLAAVATSGDYTDLTNKPVIPAPYSLPKASASELGGVKVGSGLAIDADGVLTATGGGGGGVAGVETFNGRDGAVTPQTGDYTAAMVGLGNVDNTSDASKPVSTATQAALDLKANTADLAAVATSGDYADLTGAPSPYSLPAATTDVLGGIKVGANLTVAADGTLSATGGGLPPVTAPLMHYNNTIAVARATNSTRGTVQGSASVPVDVNGVVSASLKNLTDVMPSSGMTSGSFGGRFLVGNSSATTRWTAVNVVANNGITRSDNISTTGGTITLSGDASWAKTQAINAPLTGLDTSQVGTVTASDTVLSAIGKMNHKTYWTLTTNGEYGGVYWRIFGGIIYMTSGIINNTVPANTYVSLGELPAGITGSGAVRAPCVASNITGVIIYSLESGTISAVFPSQVGTGTIYTNIAVPLF